uniref:Uncharacterized protein n=1 Tax=Arundo donax TaxID=35708 RepID=A0A0A9BM71_ARUDO
MLACMNRSTPFCRLNVEAWMDARDSWLTAQQK